MAARKRTAPERQIDLHWLAYGLAMGWTDREICKLINDERRKRVEEDLVEKLRDDGFDEDAIAQHLQDKPPEVKTISRQQVGHDKSDATKILERVTEEHVRAQIGKLDLQLQWATVQAVEAWEDSRQPTIKTIEKETLTKDGRVVKLRQVQTTTSSGDPKHLKNVLDAIEQRALLHRLRERELVDHVDDHPQFDPQRPITPEEALGLIDEKTGSRLKAIRGKLRLTAPPKG